MSTFYIKRCQDFATRTSNAFNVGVDRPTGNFVAIVDARLIEFVKHRWLSSPLSTIDQNLPKRVFSCKEFFCMNGRHLFFILFLQLHECTLRLALRCSYNWRGVWKFCVPALRRAGGVVTRTLAGTSVSESKRLFSPCHWLVEWWRKRFAVVSKKSDKTRSDRCVESIVRVDGDTSREGAKGETF